MRLQETKTVNFETNSNRNWDKSMGEILTVKKNE